MFVIVDENGNGFWSHDGIDLLPLDWMPGMDPISGLGPVPCYVLPQPVVVGDLLVVDGPNMVIQDMLRFPDDGTGTASIMYFLSDDKGEDPPPLADVGIPDPQDNIAAVPELMVAGIDYFVYRAGLATYLGLSDIYPDYDYEPPIYAGSPAGTPITGQNGWYIPSVGGTDHFVYTYAGNALGLPANPIGNTQFEGATALGNGTFPRAQHDFNFSSSTVWTTSYDVCCKFNGVLPAVDNLSSFSLQPAPPPATNASFIAVNTWADAAGATTWNAGYQIFNAAGTMSDTLYPGPAWQNLNVNHWYRQSTTFDFASNRVLSVSIINLTTGDSATAAQTDWYLAGGAAGGLPLPTAVRFFVGGSVGEVAGNISAFDNLVIKPMTPPTGRPQANPVVTAKTPAPAPAKRPANQ